MAFIVFMRTQKRGQPGKLHRPKRNYTFNRIAVPSDYIMNGGKIKEVKKIMRTQYKQFRITSTFLNDKLWSADDKMQNYNNHLVTIVNTETHKKTAFEFWGSIMKPEIETEQELLFAFYCFLSDGEGSRYGFENFCFEFGYDTDSRKAYKTFKACEKSLKKAERIGIDENMACDIMNDLQENYGC